MRHLTKQLARLASLRDLSALPGSGTSGGLVEMTDFGSNPGDLKAWTHVPGDLKPGAALIVVLHGCTQSAAGYDRGSGWSALADAYGFAVLFPEQRRSNNANGCFNWFVPGDARRDAGEPLSIRQMIAAAVDSHGIDPRRVYVTGLSAGGAMASVMLAAYPEVFAGGAIVAGLPYGTAHSVPQALERMRGQGGPQREALGDLVRAASPHRGPWPAVSVWHGTADATVNPSNAHAIVDQWRAVHATGAPGPVDAVAGYPHTVWRDAAGRAAVELFEITGMGHGTPIAARGEDHRWGVPGPFFLDARISSTRRIAETWGLIETGRRRVRIHASESPRAPAPAPAPEPAGPAQVIDKALRAAGLLR